MVLVDFKGGATFAGMSAMPHVSAVITNLAHELTLVDRMQDALSGEMVRRQELLRDAGNVASVRDYERARTAGEHLAPLPSLFIVVDEFSEMLSAKPEFIDLFVAIGRLGRSLGLHLLLASQRLEEGRLRGLESHLSYRVGLRTFSAQESRTVLGVPDAYELPPMPGLGFLKPDQSTLLRFKAAYVSGPPASARHQAVTRDESGVLQGILPWTITEVRLPDVLEPVRDPEPEPCAVRSRRSLLDVAVGRMTGLGPEAHQVWLPPLDVPDTLDELMADLAPDPEIGLVSREWRALGGLTVPLGTVDRPREQRRDTLTVDLAGASGHVAVVGGPRTGKSTLLRTLVTSLSLTTTPAGVAVLRARLRRRHLRGVAVAAAHGRHRHAVRARRRTPDRRRGDRHRRPARGVLPRARDRLDRDLPQPAGAGSGRRRLRRRVPGRGRVEHPAGRLRRPRARAAAARVTRPHLRLPRRHRVVALGRLPRRRPRPARHAARAAARRPDGLRGRPAAGRPRAAVPARSRSGAREAALPGRPPAHRRRPGRRDAGRRGRDAWSSGSARPGPARRARSCGCCPSGSRSTTCCPRPTSRPARAGGSCSPSTRRSSRRSASTRTPSRTG